MDIAFFIKSSSVDLTKYTIKDIPGSSGRFDVIARCILAALLNNDNFERNIQIWIFLEKYGTFIFDSNILNYHNFPKNELKLVDYLYNYIINPESNLENQIDIKKSDMNLFEVIDYFIDFKYNLYVLNEKGKDFLTFLGDLREQDKLGFIIGSQTGETIDSSTLKAYNLPNISLGSKSYLASSVIRLIKLNLFTLI